MSYDPYTHPQADPAAATYVPQASNYPDGYYAQDAQPYYPAQPVYQPVYAPAPQPPVVVNVTQNNGPRSFVVRRPVNHKLHAWLTLLTGGGWAFVWIPLAIRGKKIAVYR